MLTAIDRPSVDPGQTFTTTIAYGDSTHPLLPTSITQSGFTPSGTAVSREVQMSYTPYGQIASLTDPDGNQTTFAYNTCATGGGCGELSSITNALNQTTTFGPYYADGLLEARTDPNGTADWLYFDGTPPLHRGSHQCKWGHPLRPPYLLALGAGGFAVLLSQLRILPHREH